MTDREVAVVTGVAAKALGVRLRMRSPRVASASATLI